MTTYLDGERRRISTERETVDPTERLWISERDDGFDGERDDGFDGERDYGSRRRERLWISTERETMDLDGERRRITTVEKKEMIN
ncbi:hypothetical protein Bca52824_040501 [Brassica carinata]|uniref:Uncharacterized protein n=1 Tax=Brassica carinata TaxID=52824 RepID=A0A8X7RTH9_BRACI|nr:hypothetical protein Bca52824_040501 [Brassica carinata]